MKRSFFPEGSNKASWISGQETSVFQAPENPPSVQSHVTTGQLVDKEVEPLLPFKDLSCKENSSHASTAYMPGKKQVVDEFSKFSEVQEQALTSSKTTEIFVNNVIQGGLLNSQIYSENFSSSGEREEQVVAAPPPLTKMSPFLREKKSLTLQSMSHEHSLHIPFSYISTLLPQSCQDGSTGNGCPSVGMEMAGVGMTGMGTAGEQGCPVGAERSGCPEAGMHAGEGRGCPLCAVEDGIEPGLRPDMLTTTGPCNHTANEPCKQPASPLHSYFFISSQRSFLLRQRFIFRLLVQSPTLII